MKCGVVGAGVSGLTCAIRLLQQGHKVTIYADKFSPDTVSDVAAAVWYPFLTNPIKKTNKWGLETYHELTKMSLIHPESGIKIRKGREYLRKYSEPPGWSIGINGFRILEECELIGEYVFGWEFDSPVIQMNLYMLWLKSKLERLGCKFIKKNLIELNDIEEKIVINCVGLGARQLCDDYNVRPIRGQVIYLKQDPVIGRYDQQPETLTYTIPRNDVTVLGGTAQLDDWSLEIRDEDTEEILKRCASLWPELDRNKIVGMAVGLRPSRNEVRLEIEKISNKLVIHNYGHGGSGVTLSWGCANEVVKLLNDN